MGGKYLTSSFCLVFSHIFDLGKRVGMIQKSLCLGEPLPNFFKGVKKKSFSSLLTLFFFFKGHLKHRYFFFWPKRNMHSILFFNFSFSNTADNCGQNV